MKKKKNHSHQLQVKIMNFFNKKVSEVESFDQVLEANLKAQKFRENGKIMNFSETIFCRQEDNYNKNEKYKVQIEKIKNKVLKVIIK